MEFDWCDFSSEILHIHPAKRRAKQFSLIALWNMKNLKHHEKVPHSMIRDVVRTDYLHT